MTTDGACCVCEMEFADGDERYGCHDCGSVFCENCVDMADITALGCNRCIEVYKKRIADDLGVDVLAMVMIACKEGE